MFPLAVAPKTELRPVEREFAEEIFSVVDRCRPYLREWLPWVDSTVTVNDTLKFIDTSMKQRQENNGFQASIFYDGKIAGCIGFHAMDWLNRKTSLGYWVDDRLQGRGIITAACTALTSHALKDLNLNRVEICCATENLKSQAIPARLGYTREGIRRQPEWLYDHFVDHVVFSMLQSEWNR